MVFAGSTTSSSSAVNPAAASTKFPVASNAINQTYLGGPSDAFIAKIKSDGLTLLGSTYFGGHGDDAIYSIKKNNVTGSFFAAGYTTSADYPINDPASPLFHGGKEVTITEFRTDLGASIFSTILGGSADDLANSISCDGNGDMIVGGTTTSANYPMTPGGFSDTYLGGVSDGFLTKYSQNTVALSVNKESYCVGTSIGFTWQTSYSNQTKFSIDLSSNNGITWKNIALNISPATNSYQWQLTPDFTPGVQYLARIYHTSGVLGITSGNFTVLGPPVINSLNASSTTVCEGDSVIFTTHATGSQLIYQWSFGLSPIKNANDSIYKLSHVKLTDAGKYTISVNGSCSPAATNNVTLTVNPKTKITTEPDSIIVTEGDRINITIVSSGLGLTYQWYYNGSKIQNATNPSYIIQTSARSDSGAYSCQVTGQCGNDTTKIITVKVNPKTDVFEQGSGTQSGGITVQVVDNNLSGNEIQFFVTSETDCNGKITINDATGRIVATVVDGSINQGRTEYDFNNRLFSSGVYFINIECGTSHTTKKILITQ